MKHGSAETYTRCHSRGEEQENIVEDKDEAFQKWFQDATGVHHVEGCKLTFLFGRSN